MFMVFCDRCNQPVERLTVVRSRMHSLSTITAHCHGETEQMTISDRDLLSLQPDNDTQGLAFRCSMLP